MDAVTQTEKPPTEFGVTGAPPGAVLHRKCPTVVNFRQCARRRVPRFAFEYMDGGAGADGGIQRNWSALDAIELVPRYGLTTALPPIGIELFGRRYAGPIGIAPMGGPALVWPGADEHLARAAQAARIPYVLGVVATATIERIGQLAPDVFWFQLYRFPGNGHAVGLDLARRAEAAGAHALVLTLDTPVRTVRTREAAAGVTSPFRPDWRMIASMLASPAWLAALIRNGVPRFLNLRPYVGETAGLDEIAAFARKEMTGAFTWEEVALYRDRWRGPLVVKGVMHPDDAERAISLGADGILVSNHGGRQVEGLAAAIDVLPAIAARVGGRAVVMMDSGIRSGLDVVRAGALGAQAGFAGKAFLWSLGALGPDGPGHAIELFLAEIRAALGQLGAQSLAQARTLVIRHAGALQF